MAFKRYFFLTEGLSKSLTVPQGTKERIAQHVCNVEQNLNLQTEQYLDNPPHWDWKSKKFEGIDDELLCYWVERHNEWTRSVYEDFARWSENPPTSNTEELTPDDAKAFWYAFETLEVPVHRWSRDFYKSRMQHFYEVLRGRESEGATIGCKALSEKQANAVIWLFSFLDKNDIRLEVPKGGDELCSSDDGEYDWCEKCGAVYPDNAYSCRNIKCPLKEM